MDQEQSNFFLRGTDGKVVKVPNHFKYLEIRSSDDLTAVVFAIEGNKIVMFTKDDPEAARYMGNFKEVKFCQKIDLDI
jgi:hypothetical protein